MERPATLLESITYIARGRTLKLHAFFLLTHGTSAAAVAMLMIASSRSESTFLSVGASILSLITLLVAAWYASARVRTGLSLLEAIVAGKDSTETPPTSLIEIDQSADRIADHSAQWESVAADNRQQARDFQSMMFLLNRRGPDRKPSSDQLRALLAGLGNTMHARLEEIETSAGEVELRTNQIIEGADLQSNAVVKTTAYLEQLYGAIDTVSNTAEETETAIKRTTELATATQASIAELSSGLAQIRTDSQSCEKKLRGLCDPAQQISAIVETICDIASRTDLLALNASIESIRAGEHGKQFAKVADEVRKLAEQATDATREIASLIDSMQLVTQESIHRIAKGRETIENNATRVATAEDTLSEICKSSSSGASKVRQINEASNGQLQLAQNVVMAVEQISEIARSARGDAETACWTIKSLSKTPADFESAVSRLRQCAGAPDPEPEQQTSTPVPVTPAVPTTATPDLVSAN